MAAFNLNYEFLRDRGQINLNISYSGDQTDTFFPPFPEPQQTVLLDAYTLVNLSSSFAMTDEITIYGRIENLFDETYENVFGYATPGIGGYLGARMSFGN
jgi:vitamin B12 transporter